MGRPPNHRMHKKKPPALAALRQLVSSGFSRDPYTLARMMKELFSLVVLISALFCPQWATAIVESEIIIHQDDINLRTSSGWSGSSLKDLFRDDAIKEVHLVSTMNRGDKDTVRSEIKSILNGEISATLISELHVAANNRLWAAFLVTDKGRTFLIRKTWYQCFIVSHGPKQGVYRSEKSKYDSEPGR